MVIWRHSLVVIIWLFCSVFVWSPDYITKGFIVKMMIVFVAPVLLASHDAKDGDWHFVSDAVNSSLKCFSYLVLLSLFTMFLLRLIGSCSSSFVLRFFQLMSRHLLCASNTGFEDEFWHPVSLASLMQCGEPEIDYLIPFCDSAPTHCCSSFLLLSLCSLFFAFFSLFS